MGIEDIAFGVVKSWWGSKKNRERTIKLIIKELEYNKKLIEDTHKLAEVYISTNVRPAIIFFPFQTKICDMVINSGLIFLLDMEEENIDLFVDLNNRFIQINELIKSSNNQITIAATPIEPDNRHGTMLAMLIRNELTGMAVKIDNILKKLVRL